MADHSDGEKQNSGAPGARPALSADAQKRRAAASGKSLKRRSFESVDKVLSQVVNRLGLERRLKEHTLLHLWPVFVPDPIAQKSRPLFIDIEGNLVVAIKDASVGQELSLNRTEILKKLNVAGNSMGIKLRGMRFDLKRYHDSARAMEAAQTHPGARTVKEPGVSELAEIALSQSDAEQVAELRANLQSSLATDSSLATRMISMFEQELKLKIWRERQGFPRCSACKTAVQVLHGTAQYCADCFFESQSRA